MNQDLLSLSDYKIYLPQDRANYLNEHVHSTTDLSPDFCTGALGWETYSIAKWYLVRAIGILRLKSATPLVLRICKESDEKFPESSLHLIAAWTLGRIGEDVITPLISELRISKNVETTICLVDALGEIRSPRAINSLESALKEREYEVKLWAALSLSKIGKEALNTLYNLFSNSKNREERILLLDAIAKINDDSSKPFIKKALQEGSDEEKKFILSNCANCFDQSFLGEN